MTQRAAGIDKRNGKPEGRVAPIRRPIAFECSATDTMHARPPFTLGDMIENNARKVVLQRKFDPELVLKTIQDERITITHMAPTMVQALAGESVGRQVRCVQSEDVRVLRRADAYTGAAPRPQAPPGRN